MKSREEIELELEDTIRNIAECPNKDGLLARALDERRRTLEWVLRASDWVPVKASDNGAAAE